MSRQAGFTLVEMLVTLALMGILMVVFLSTLNASAHLATSQNSLAEITEDLRFSMAGVARLTRMAGAGGLPIVYDADSDPDVVDLQPLAIALDDNVIAGLTLGGREVVAGSDILTLRGVLVEDVIGVDAEDIEPKGNPKRLGLSLRSQRGNRAQAIPEHLSRGDLMVLMLQRSRIISSSFGTREVSDYRVGVVEEDADSQPYGQAKKLGIVVNGDPAGGQRPDQAAVLALNPEGEFSAVAAQQVVGIGVVDDIRLFIAEDDSGEPSLYHWNTAAAEAQLLVSGMQDLQVALGCDLDGDGVLAAQEWMASAARSTPPTADQLSSLRAVRLSLTARGADERRIAVPAAPAPPENGNQIYDRGQATGQRLQTLSVQVGLRNQTAFD